MKMVWCARGSSSASRLLPVRPTIPSPSSRATTPRCRPYSPRHQPTRCSPAVQEEIKQHINAAFDFRELSRLALGDHWEERSPDERDHFAETFSSIIREQNFDSFSRYYREGEIRYESAEVQEDAAVVQALAPVRDEQIEIEYKLHRVEGVWRIYDLVIDGVSTAEGNRRRYARYIEKNGYEKLIVQLDKQLARLRETILSPPSACGATED